MEKMNSVPRLDALHYLFTEKSDRIVAHCLDLDLVAVGKDRPTAEHRLNLIVATQIAGAYSAGNHAVLLFHAPSQFWRTMNKAQNLPNSTLTIETTPPMTLPIEQRFTVELPVFRSLMAA